MRENVFINKYLSKLIKKNSGAKNLNDDIFYDKKNKLAVTVDTYNEGIHFLNFKYPDLIIKKIIRSSISDLISKGVVPKYYFISASLKKNTINKIIAEKIIKSLAIEQKKFNIKISGGDTTTGVTNSFTITSIGFSNKIIERNHAKINDDIYVTGNIGDSFIGLQLIKKKIKLNNKKSNFFFKRKYYVPDVPFNSIKIIKKFANTSIDVSDGLIGDLNKLINKQNVNYILDIKKIPTSKLFKDLVNSNNFNIENLLFNGDDYQTLFTSSSKNKKKIFTSFKKMNQKVTIIGKIIKKSESNFLKIGKKYKNIRNYKGYLHNV